MCEGKRCGEASLYGAVCRQSRKRKVWGKSQTAESTSYDAILLRHTEGCLWQSWFTLSSQLCYEQLNCLSQLGKGLNVHPWRRVDLLKGIFSPISFFLLSNKSLYSWLLNYPSYLKMLCFGPKCLNKVSLFQRSTVDCGNWGSVFHSGCLYFGIVKAWLASTLPTCNLLLFSWKLKQLSRWCLI